MGKKKKETLADVKPPSMRDRIRQKHQQKLDKELAKENAKTERLSPEERAKYYKKPPLARLWDKFLPGDYTMRQDRNHALVIFVVIALILLLTVAALWINLDKASYSESAVLVIPNSTYSKGGEENVVKMLENYGYNNISINYDTITAKGTPEKVKAYQDSFYEKNVKSAVDSIKNGDFAEYGVEKITLSDDFKTLSFYTPLYLNVNADSMSSVVTADEINKIITSIHSWCAMINNNEPLTVSFRIMSLRATDEEEEYFSTTSSANGSQIVAAVEKEIAKNQEQAQKENKDNTE